MAACLSLSHPDLQYVSVGYWPSPFLLCCGVKTVSATALPSTSTQKQCCCHRVGPVCVLFELTVLATLADLHQALEKAALAIGQDPVALQHDQRAASKPCPSLPSIHDAQNSGVSLGDLLM